MLACSCLLTVLFPGLSAVSLSLDDRKGWKKARGGEEGRARAEAANFPASEGQVREGGRIEGYPGFQTTTYTSRSYSGIAPGYTYQFPEFHLERTPLLTSSHPPELAGQWLLTERKIKAVQQQSQVKLKSFPKCQTCPLSLT
ncbi:RNA-binding protein Musashi-like protein 1 [Larimichthys crocea]|uniref:Uncharacterized protein n=1 Tax=Larimichthys crocea TaxID=215358 RepID=A0ACD3RK99_LARCR|nr:RNA-binding protein Musashi-like protein 1 [Larimichthys crocea]